MNKFSLFSSLLFLFSISHAQTLETNKAKPDGSGCLTYEADANQNRIPDFSHAGYKGGGEGIPELTVMQTISPVTGDDTANIQAAIDAVGALTPDANGFRGAVLLNPGTYEVSGQLFLNTSGVVLRGAGDGRDTNNPTIILGTGNTPTQRNLVVLGGGNTGSWFETVSGTTQNITSNFVQVGSYSFEVADTSPYSVGDNIIVYHPGSAAWLAAIDNGGGINDPDWSVNQFNIIYNRFITDITGNQITVDAPVYNHLDKSLSQSYIYTYDRQNLVTNVGIENLRIDIESAGGTDENHAWSAIAFHQAEDGWAKNLTATGFGYAGVTTRKATRITIKNVHAIDPVSQIAGGRRYNFSSENFSNNILYEDCYANNGRHSYAVNGTPSASGIVFLRSTSENPLSTSEPHRQWSQGILYDNFRDFGTLPNNRRVIGLYNRGDAGSTHGWAAVNSILWNVDVSRPGADGKIILEKPPIGQNYAIGTKGDIDTGPNNGSLGYVEHSNATGQLQPQSLYEAQLLCRTNTVISDFESSVSVVAPLGTVIFTENAQGNVTSYSWDFGTDATPSTASGPGPHDVTYSSTGLKTVKLTVSNGTQSNERIKFGTVNVTTSTILAVNDEETLDQNSQVTTSILDNDTFPPNPDNFALSFDGIDDKISYGDFTTDLIVSDYPFTMSAWYKTTSNDEQYITYLGRSSSGVSRNSILINAGVVELEANVFSGSSTFTSISDNQTTNDGEWHHVAAVYASPTSRLLYVDGILKGTDNANIDNLSGNLNRFSVGVNDNTNTGNGTVPFGFFEGEIDEVRIYASSLSPGDVNDIMSGRDCSTNVKSLYYNFNDQSTTVAEDQFNNFDGTITGATSVASSLSIGELEASIVSGPSNGLASFSNDFEITYTPNTGFTGTDSLTYELRFGECEISQATITYTIQIASCTIPINLQATSVAQTSADISWDNVADATGGYDYVLIDDGSIPDDTTMPDANLPSGTNSVSLSSLTDGTTYDFYLRSDCGSGNVSDWSIALSFTTITAGNTALSFDGVDDKVSFGTFSNPPDAVSYPFTMTAWYNTTATGDQFIVYKGRSSSNFLGHTIRMDSGIIRLEAVLGSGSANTKAILDSGTTNDGQWHHVAAVFESPTSRSLYVDGILKGTDSELADVFGIGLPVRFSVGVRDDATPNGFFSGEIDEVRIYESALSQIQIQNVMDGLSCSNYNESLYYDFNEISLPAVVDEFGNQDATITGATIVSSPLILVIDTSPDTDTDGVSDLCDLDDDNDGILDTDEENLTNVALSGTASQSSTAFGGDASRAIDGNTDGNFNNNSVTHTDDNSTTEYWQVDLGDNYNISEIIFYNRTNCCSDRISNVFVFVADTAFPSNVNDLAGAQANADFTFQFANGESAASVSIPVNASGRYVRLQKSGNNTNNYLNIAELEVFALLDTDGDGIADAMELDSDNDGCSDANEYYENSNADNNADGNDDDEYGDASAQSVDAFGQVIGASYSGSAIGLANVRDENVADACTFVQDTSGDWNTASNWSTNTIPQANQLAIIDDGVNSNFDQSVGVKRLTLRPNSQLNVNPTGILNIGEQLTNEGLIIFESDATGSAQLDSFSGTISGTGDVTTERFIPAEDNINGVNLGRAYRILTSTVTTSANINANWQEGATTNTENPNPGYGTHITGSSSGANGFDATPSGNPSMFTFNSSSTGPAAQDWEVIPGTDGSNNLKAGKAYLTFIRGDRSVDVTDNSTTPTNTTLRAKGDLISGQINYAADIDNMATAPGDYSLVANPYQAVVDYLETDRTNLTDFFYVWDASISARGAYVTVDISDVLNVSNNVNDSDADNFLSPGQAFFVQNNINGNGLLTYNENDKNTSGNQVTIFSTNTEFVIRSSLFKTNESQEENALVDGLVVRFNNNYTTPADYEDAEKFINLDENYAVVNNGLRSIDKQALPGIGHEVQLSITSFTDNNYSLVYEISNKPEGLGVFLKDNYLGTQTELSESSAYNFSIDANIPESISEYRFSLVFDNTTLGVNDNAFGTDFRLYPNPTRDGLFRIKTQGLRGKDVKVELYNVLGQQLINQTLRIENNGLVNVDGSGLSTGVYMVKLKQDEQEFIGKLIVE